MWALYRANWRMLSAELAWVGIGWVVISNVVGLVQREIFNKLTGDAIVSLGIWELTAVLVALAIAAFILLFGGVIFHFVNQFTIASLLRRNALGYVLVLSGDHSLPESSGESLSRFAQDAELVAQYVLLFKFMVGHVTFSIIALYFMVRISPLITFAVFLPFIAVIAIVNATRTRIERYRSASRDTAGDVAGFIGEMFGTAEAVKVANAEARMIRRFREINDDRRATTLRDTLLTDTLGAIFSNVQSLGTGLVLIVAGQSMSQGTFTVGDLSLFVFYTGATQGFSQDIGRLLTGHKQVRVSIDRLLELMPGAPPRELVEPGPIFLRGPLPEVPHVVKQDSDRLDTLEIKGLSYLHPESGQGIRDIDLTLQRGTFTVLTGRVGSGKTTLLRSLLGLVSKDAGEIRWNDDSLVKSLCRSN